MRRALLAVALFLLVLALPGCDLDTRYSVDDQTEFMPESGPSQYVLLRSMSDAMADLDFTKYADKKVYLNVLGGSNYTQGLAENMALSKLREAKAIILTRLTQQEEESGLKEDPGDYELNVIVVACGVHMYDGIIRRNIEGLTMVGLHEKVPKGQPTVTSGKLHRCRYEGWVFSPYFIVALLAFVTVLAVIGAVSIARIGRGISKSTGTASLH